jgi:hypothetical protein
MATVHWLGTGLSSVPGIHRLGAAGQPLMVWNRTVANAEAAVAGLAAPPPVRALEAHALAAALQPGDVLVSMLPADRHPDMARLALEHGAHFISSSYLSPEIASLDADARAAGLCLVNEVGLDPGLDHLLAHQILHDYRSEGVHQDHYRLRFRSLCGGFPAEPNDFRYQFSWSPVGVLRALRAPSRCIENGEVREVARPWQGLSRYCAQLPAGQECFEAYANRDSLPFIEQYGIDPAWQLDRFVRGTLRLEGWSQAWAPIFQELDTLEGSTGEARLAELGRELWQAHRYRPGEADRVVLCVELEALDGEACVWRSGLCIDARGSARGSAMARLVSHTVSLAVTSVLAGELPAGVSTAPADPALLARWLEALAALGDRVEPLPRSTGQ